jgi:hypothetical protein
LSNIAKQKRQSGKWEVVLDNGHRQIIVWPDTTGKVHVFTAVEYTAEARDTIEEERMHMNALSPPSVSAESTSDTDTGPLVLLRGRKQLFRRTLEDDEDDVDLPGMPHEDEAGAEVSDVASSGATLAFPPASSHRDEVATTDYFTAEMETLATFMAVGGIEDMGFARDFLQGNGWQIQASVNAYMNMIGQGAGSRSRLCPVATFPTRTCGMQVLQAAADRGQPPLPLKISPTSLRLQVTLCFRALSTRSADRRQRRKSTAS